MHTRISIGGRAARVCKGGIRILLWLDVVIWVECLPNGEDTVDVSILHQYVMIPSRTATGLQRTHGVTRTQGQRPK